MNEYAYDNNSNNSSIVVHNLNKITTTTRHQPTIDTGAKKCFLEFSFAKLLTAKCFCLIFD